MGRTEQDRILLAERAETIRIRAKKYSISSYELGQNTDLSIGGAKKILEGTSKTPSEVSLDIIDKYIEKTYENKELQPTIVAEEKIDYPDYRNLSVDEKLNIILKKMDKFDVLLDAIALKQEIIFEITKLAKAGELKVYEEESAKINSKQKQH